MKNLSPATILSFLLLPTAVLLLNSCGEGAGENYDTEPTPTYSGGNPGLSPAPHPTYGDAAYGDQPAITNGEGATTPPVVTNLPSDTANIPMNPPNAAGAREHYVAPGDSLWKISRIYKVPVESIKQANGMTSDTVVLGKKIIIPAQ